MQNSKLPNWQQELKSAVQSVDQLLALLKLSDNDLPYQINSNPNRRFALLATQSFISRIRPQDPYDPLLLQILPQYAETISQDNFNLDGLQELQYNPLPGLLHKYRSRVLLTITGGCAIHCRYCFRQHFPYQTNIAGKSLVKIINYILSHPEIDEIILSGGDPLLITDDQLIKFLDKLADIPQITTIRFHTRLPVVLPSRSTDKLVNYLANYAKKIVIVIHANHPQELNGQVQQGLIKLAETQAVLLNQSVLLKNINNNPKILANLSRRLFACRVMPYYLHLPDKVAGTQHFYVDLAAAQPIYHQLQSMLPGYLVPKLVQEIPGELSKTICI